MTSVYSQDQSYVGEDAHEHPADHAHPPYLAHHWDNPKQQFEAGKLGMWLFLATEVLLFGGLFCGYSVWRGNHPELFKYGSQFLDTKMGAINTAVLIASSLTMAWGVTAAQQNKQGLLKLMLILTLAGAVTFLVIKYFEYSHKFHEGWYPGLKFYEQPGHHAHTWQPDLPPVIQPGLEPLALAPGATLETTPAGSTPGDVHGIDVPVGAASAPATTPAATQPAARGFELETISITMQPVSTDPGLPPVEASTVKPAAIGDRGLAEEPEITEEPLDLNAGREEHEQQLHPLQDSNRPYNTHMFFNIYFMMTGLHGIHVVIGMIVITWLLVGAFKGKFNSEYFTPVDLGGLYWHVVDLIWIFLFPLFYLI